MKLVEQLNRVACGSLGVGIGWIFGALSCGDAFWPRAGLGAQFLIFSIIMAALAIEVEKVVKVAKSE